LYGNWVTIVIRPLDAAALRRQFLAIAKNAISMELQRTAKVAVVKSSQGDPAFQRRFMRCDRLVIELPSVFRDQNLIDRRLDGSRRGGQFRLDRQKGLLRCLQRPIAVLVARFN
jgi:hypothetical protein